MKNDSTYRTLTIKQHRDLAAHLQFRLDALSVRTPPAERDRVNASIAELRIVLQEQLSEDYPDAGNLYA